MLDDIVALCQSDRLYCGIPSLSVIAIGDTGWKSQWNMGIPYCVSDTTEIVRSLCGRAFIWPRYYSMLCCTHNDLVLVVGTLPQIIIWRYKIYGRLSESCSHIEKL